MGNRKDFRMMHKPLLLLLMATSTSQHVQAYSRLPVQFAHCHRSCNYGWITYAIGIHRRLPAIPIFSPREAITLCNVQRDKNLQQLYTPTSCSSHGDQRQKPASRLSGCLPCTVAAVANGQCTHTHALACALLNICVST